MDSGLSVTFKNGRLTSPDAVPPGKFVRIVDFDGTTAICTDWTGITVCLKENHITTHALAIVDVP